MTEVVYGAGGHGRELAFQLKEQKRCVDAFVDDFQFDRIEQGVPVFNYQDAVTRLSASAWHIAIGDITARNLLLLKVRNAGITIGGFISPHTIVAPSAQIGSSTQIFGQSVVSDSCFLAEDIIVNFGCTVSHDVHIDTGSILCPRVSIAGNVRIGKNVWLGVGCTVSNGSPGKPLVIEDGAYIGAGACVIGDVTANTVVYGIPAKRIRDRKPNPTQS